MTTTFLFDELYRELFHWWVKHGRVLPWRAKLSPAFANRTKATIDDVLQVREVAFTEYMAVHLRREPYRVVVAELMLQQTQVDRVLPKYLAWMEQWPGIDQLAQAQLSDVLVFWKGLGYNRRARFLWLLAKKISEELHGTWPQTEDELLKLPGLGKYTARAVMSFAFGQEVAVVDTNVKRVLRRILDGLETLTPPLLTEKEWFSRADSVLPPGQADPWNQLIMDLGAMVCTAKAPKCEACPVVTLCRAQQLALSKGFDSYKEYLKANPLEKRTSKKVVRFEDSDRYFRGRIMDLLRDRQFPQDELWQVLNLDHGLLDVSRYEKLLHGLIKDGMIRNSDNTLTLG